jgi:hypothetical protein
MFAKLDISEVTKLADRADRELDKVLPIMRGAVAMKVAFEKSTHEYKNITGNLEKSTIAYDAADPRDRVIEVHSEMGMHYASNVRDRGRTDYDANMKAAGKNIERRFEGMAERLAKK